jgi:hypothetical protein
MALYEAIIKDRSKAGAVGGLPHYKPSGIAVRSCRNERSFGKLLDINVASELTGILIEPAWTTGWSFD